MLKSLAGKLHNKDMLLDRSARAAVTILLIDDAENPQILLVKRANRETDPWSGHMAFPGGRHSHLDSNLLDTAHRETKEETDIDLSKCILFGSMDSFNSTVVPDLFIQPFIFVCDVKPVITLNDELIAHYWVSLEKIRKSRCDAQIGLNRFPAFHIEGETIWGLTYRMLEKLIRIISED